MKAGRAAALALALGPIGTPALAQETHEHGYEHTHEEHIHSLHFTHPLIAESVTPDTKVRLDFARPRPAAGQEWELEGEYAFSHRFSIEVGASYESLADDFGHSHVTAKFANYSLHERGILIGFGAGAALPILSASHSEEEPGADPVEEAEHEDAWELEPFVNLGLKRGDWELTGWAKYSHAFATDDARARNWGSYNLGVLLHATTVIQPLLELHGIAIGDEATPESSSITPSLRFVPLRGKGLALAAGVSFPLSDEREFDSQLAASLFWHF